MWFPPTMRLCINYLVHNLFLACAHAERFSIVSRLCTQHMVRRYTVAIQFYFGSQLAFGFTGLTWFSVFLWLGHLSCGSQSIPDCAYNAWFTHRTWLRIQHSAPTVYLATQVPIGSQLELGYALCRRFSITFWLHIKYPVPTSYLAVHLLFGSQIDSGYASLLRFTNCVWLRISVEVLTYSLVTQDDHGSHHCHGFTDSTGLSLFPWLCI